MREIGALKNQIPLNTISRRVSKAKGWTFWGPMVGRWVGYRDGEKCLNSANRDGLQISGEKEAKLGVRKKKKMRHRFR